MRGKRRISNAEIAEVVSGECGLGLQAVLDEINSERTEGTQQIPVSESIVWEYVYNFQAERDDDNAYKEWVMDKQKNH